MADGQGTEAVEVTTAEPTVSATDFVPLDDSDSPVNGHDGDDSASDVPMTTETDDEDDDDENVSPPYHQSVQLDPVVSESNSSIQKPGDELTRKRKSSDDMSDNNNGHIALESVKKMKLAEPMEEHQDDDSPPSDRSQLPAEVWQHIFTFCPPRTLGRLLRVNRLFNVYLDTLSTIQCKQPTPLSRTAVPMTKPNAIWQSSRRRFWPNMPSPLQDQMELYMWQLSCSYTCQHCRSSMSQQEDYTDPWQSGPGKDGIAIIWPFATRSCGLCLLSKSTKEIDILLSSTIPSTLTAALPFVLVTQELHVVSPATVERGQPPAVGQLTKLYWSAHVEDLKREFFSTKAMGTATIEEWLKGLDGRGVERRTDASRWEKWATVNDGLRQMRTLLYPGHQPPVIASHGGTTTSIGGVPSHAGRIPGIDITNESSPVVAPSVSSIEHNESAPHPFRRSSSGTSSHVSGRHERTKEEVAEMKAARKAEIERRAFAFDPPLPAHILAHIPSFQAALQIISPMDDQGWEVLRPRLLAQRADAEQREKDSVARAKQEFEEKRNANATKSDTRDATNADDCGWDEAQAPVRACIAGYADEIIRDGWEDGEKVGRDNCAKFAVEALNHIRKRFYAEVAKDAAAARAAGKPPIVDPPQGPFTQKLTLENMKWIFDVKIKPLTERYRKEIFMCNGCDVTVRSYGFEGVIQHYAAKHTTALSIGNVVVHWRAEWPEYPPFTSEPKPAKSSLQTQTAPSGYNAQQPGLSQPYQPAPGGPALGYGPPAWGESARPGSQVPYTTTPGGYLPPRAYVAPPYPPTDSGHPYPTAQVQQLSYNGPLPPASGGPYNYNYGAYHSNSQAGYQPVQPSPFSAQYSVQLEDMAHMARDLWNSTTNMKDTLSIVRVQVVVYHLAKRFHAKFHMPLPLLTFIDGLSNHKDMRPVRNVNGLICRVCHQSIGGYVASEEERKSWSLPQLTAHFQSKHVEPFVQMGQYGQQPEWTVDMVLLPDPAAVTHLRAAISMDGLKYHLVNEAVPHLLQAPSVPQAAADRAPLWHDENSNSQYQGYQNTPIDNPAPYYGQHQPNGPIQVEGTGLYPSAVEAAAQFPHEPSFACNPTEQLAVSGNPIPPAGAYPPVEPAPHSVALSRGDENENKSSQGHRQRFKKNKKKGTTRDNLDEEARKRSEEEEKMAEEEAEREADVIRAMWAADRAVAARKSVVPEGQQPEKQGKANKPSNSKPQSKPNTPKRNHRFQSRPPRNSPRRDEGVSPLGVRGSQADPVTPAQPDGSYRSHQLSNVAYVDEKRDKHLSQEWQRSPNPYDRYGPHPPNAGPPRSPSPERKEHSRPTPAIQYRQRSPRRQPADEPVYQPRPPGPVDDVRYQRGPTREEYPNRGFGAPAPAPELIEYEIIEYRNPDGTIYVEERPLRRIPNSEADRYYREAPPPVPALYDRGEPLSPLPHSYRRDQPPPAASGEPYHPPYERAYSRAPQPQPLVQGGANVYDPRYPFHAHSRHNEPPLPPSQRAEPAYYEEEEYDPRYPNGPSNVPVHISRPTTYR